MASTPTDLKKTQSEIDYSLFSDLGKNDKNNEQLCKEPAPEPNASIAPTLGSTAWIRQVFSPTEMTNRAYAARLEGASVQRKGAQQVNYGGHPMLACAGGVDPELLNGALEAVTKILNNKGLVDALQSIHVVTNPAKNQSIPFLLNNLKIALTQLNGQPLNNNFFQTAFSKLNVSPSLIQEEVDGITQILGAATKQEELEKLTQILGAATTQIEIPAKAPNTLVIDNLLNNLNANIKNLAQAVSEGRRAYNQIQIEVTRVGFNSDQPLSPYEQGKQGWTNSRPQSKEPSQTDLTLQTPAEDLTPPPSSQSGPYEDFSGEVELVDEVPPSSDLPATAKTTSRPNASPQILEEPTPLPPKAPMGGNSATDIPATLPHELISQGASAPTSSGPSTTVPQMSVPEPADLPLPPPPPASSQTPPPPPSDLTRQIAQISADDLIKLSSGDDLMSLSSADIVLARSGDATIASLEVDIPKSRISSTSTPRPAPVVADPMNVSGETTTFFVKLPSSEVTPAATPPSTPVVTTDPVSGKVTTIFVKPNASGPVPLPPPPAPPSGSTSAPISVPPPPPIEDIGDIATKVGSGSEVSPPSRTPPTEGFDVGDMETLIGSGSHLSPPRRFDPAVLANHPPLVEPAPPPVEVPSGPWMETVTGGTQELSSVEELSSVAPLATEGAKASRLAATATAVGRVAGPIAVGVGVIATPLAIKGTLDVYSDVQHGEATKAELATSAGSTLATTAGTGLGVIGLATGGKALVIGGVTILSAKVIIIGGIACAIVGSPIYAVYDKLSEDRRSELMFKFVEANININSNDLEKKQKAERTFQGVNGPTGHIDGLDDFARKAGYYKKDKDGKPILGTDGQPIAERFKYITSIAQKSDDDTFVKLFEEHLAKYPDQFLDMRKPEVAAFWKNPELKPFLDEGVNTLLGPPEGSVLASSLNPGAAALGSLHRNLINVGKDDFAIGLILAQLSDSPLNIQRAEKVYNNRWFSQSGDRKEFQKWKNVTQITSDNPFINKIAPAPLPPTTTPTPIVTPLVVESLVVDPKIETKITNANKEIENGKQILTKNPQRAIKHYQEAIALLEGLPATSDEANHSRGVAYMRLGAAYQGLGQTTNAKANYSNALVELKKITLSEKIPHFELGFAAYGLADTDPKTGLQKYKEAISEFKAALNDKKYAAKTNDALENLSNIYSQMGEVAKQSSLPTRNQEVKEAFENALVYAQKLKNTDSTQQALGELESVSKKMINEVKQEIEAGKKKRSATDIKGAMTNYRNAIEKAALLKESFNPSLPLNESNLQNYYLLTGTALMRLGEALQASDDSKGAIESYSQALSALNSVKENIPYFELGYATYGKARIDSTLSNYLEAAKQFERALGDKRYAHQKNHTLDNLSNIYYEMGKLTKTNEGQKAKEYFTRALECAKQLGDEDLKKQAEEELRTL